MVSSRAVTLNPAHRLGCSHARPPLTVTLVPSAGATAKSSSVEKTPLVRVEKWAAASSAS